MGSHRERRRILSDLERASEGLFPYKTCPASRHVRLIVERMLDPKSPLHRALGSFEPDHMAGSIASVLESLWKARRWMRWQPNIVGDYMKGGEWVPDLDVIAASVDTHPKGGDAKQAPFMGSAVPNEDSADAPDIHP